MWGEDSINSPSTASCLHRCPGSCVLGLRSQAPTLSSHALAQQRLGGGIRPSHTHLGLGSLEAGTQLCGLSVMARPPGSPWQWPGKQRQTHSGSGGGGMFLKSHQMEPGLPAGRRGNSCRLREGSPLHWPTGPVPTPHPPGPAREASGSWRGWTVAGRAGTKPQSRQETEEG